MGKLNVAFIYGRVSKPPVIQKDRETGEYIYGMVYVDTVRGVRQIDDDVRYVKHDHPLIMSREKAILDIMSEWKENDMVYIKGVISTKVIPKSSFCPNCKDEAGKPTKNEVNGNLVYITPIYAEKKASYPDKNSAIDDLVAHREISNQAYVFGTLIREPKIFRTKRGIQITQYPIALNRKFTIRTDDPSIRTDWPIVKSYGEQAIEDKLYLQYQAEVIIDGFLQARTLTRKIKCKCCGQIYEYKDNAMELVPYGGAVEYISGHKSKEQVEAEHQKSIEAAKQDLFVSNVNDELDDNMKTEDLI